MTCHMRFVRQVVRTAIESSQCATIVVPVDIVDSLLVDTNNVPYSTNTPGAHLLIIDDPKEEVDSTLSRYNQDG